MHQQLRKLGNDDPLALKLCGGWLQLSGTGNEVIHVPAVLADIISIWLAMAVTVVASNLATRYLLDQERQAMNGRLDC